MTKEFKYPNADGLGEIIVTTLGERERAPHRHLSIWLCQGSRYSDGNCDTQYHVSTVDGELDELIKKLLQIRAKKDKFLEYFNKSR